MKVLNLMACAMVKEFFTTMKEESILENGNRIK
jgi:hypothetical protein